MTTLTPFSGVTGEHIARAARTFGTPLYLYDQALIEAKCAAFLSMPHAFGLTVRYAMKANPNRSLLRLIHAQGIGIDASSLNEALRAELAGIPAGEIMLTSQEVPASTSQAELEGLLLRGMRYNICSLRQLERVGPLAKKYGLDLSIRVHPGEGTGESASRNTGDKYCCFGVHLKDLPRALELTQSWGLRFTQVHTHIGSGGDPEVWRRNVPRQLELVEKFFPDAQSVSFGGGMREARMPDETAEDLESLGTYAKACIEDFQRRTGRSLRMEVEPGTALVANAGFLVLTVLDKKDTEDLHFLIADGGMDVNSRPALYGSRHPFYMVQPDGAVLSSEYGTLPDHRAILVGTCCESGDAQCLDETGHVLARPMGDAQVGDYAVVGGAGAYCAGMSLFNYNSHLQAPEVLLTPAGDLRLIRRRQTLAQVTENEV